MIFFLLSFSGLTLQHVQYLEEKILWCAYWVGLGILSSVGLGTGLHTFLLYLVRGTVIENTDMKPPRYVYENILFIIYLFAA